MSRVRFACALIPPPADPCDRVYGLYDDEFRVPGTAAFAEADEDLVRLPDARAYRALSRAGLLLVAAGLPARECVAPIISADPFAVGIYCAMEQGPNDYHAAKQMIDTTPAEFAAAYKTWRSAKHYFKQLPNVPPAELGIFLGAMGPLYTFTHSSFACRHALEHAERDLETAAIQAAMVCAAFSLEDPLLSLRARRALPATVTLSEGAACLVLTAGDGRADWSRLSSDSPSVSYGIATDLVALARRSPHDLSHLERTGAALAG